MRGCAKHMLFAMLLAAQGLPLACASGNDASLKVTTVRGAAFDLSAQRGHWVVVNYWATTCVPCLEEMPMLGKFAASHPDVRLIGLTYEPITPDTLRHFLSTHPANYPVALVDEAALPATLKPTFMGMHVLPLTYVVAPDGTVAKRWVGELDQAKLQTLAGMLQQQR